MSQTPIRRTALGIVSGWLSSDTDADGLQLRDPAGVEEVGEGTWERLSLTHDP